jgi:hypothetical protein
MKTIVSIILILGVFSFIFYLNADQYAYQQRVVHHALGKEYVIGKDTVLITDGDAFNGYLLTNDGRKINYRMFYPDFYEHKNPNFDLDSHYNKLK